MKISCLIIEDEPLARNLITDYVSRVPYLNLLKSFANPLEALDFIRENPPDLIFLDINMPDISGINFLKIMRQKPMVIFTTAYSEYAVEGYDLDVVDYLLKPITFDRFLRSVEKADQKFTHGKSTPAYVSTTPGPDRSYFFVKDGTKLIKVRWEDILYIEGLKDYVIIHTRQQKVISLQRMKTLEEELPVDRFIRVHNSYIVSIENIGIIHKERIEIGDVSIPISDTYRKKFREFIERRHFK